MPEEVDQIQLIESDKKNGSRSRRTTNKRANDLDGATWTRYSISVWRDIRKTHEEIALKHPAMFPTQLAARLIQCFTTSEDRFILDPFVGIGSTVLAAELLGKIGIGLDVSENYIHKAQERPAPPRDMFESSAREENVAFGERRLYVADANDLLSYVKSESVDMVITSPPYWDILLQNRTADYKDVRHYGESDKDIGKIHNYKAFLMALTCIFANVYEVLKPEKYCCVIVMDLRKKNCFYPLHADVAGLMQNLGFIFDDIIIWDRSHEYNNLRPLGHPAVFRINKVHEYILIFKKPSQ